MRCNTEIRKLDSAVFDSENVGCFDIAMTYTLIVKVLETVEDLGYVACDEFLWKFSKSPANRG